jgi:hypothetical protein
LIGVLAGRHGIEFYRPRHGNVEVVQVVIHGMKGQILVLPFALARL